MIWIPSYKRPKVLTKELLPKWSYKIVIPESQKDAYLQDNEMDEIITIPDNMDGSVSKKRNAILDLIWVWKWGFVFDDDITYFCKIKTGEKISAEQVVSIFQNLADMADDLWVWFCWINNINDKLWYNWDFMPFSTQKRFWWAFAIKVSKIRYDESLTRGEDVDFYYKHIHRDHKILRDNRYGMMTKWQWKWVWWVTKTDAQCVPDFLRLQKRWWSKFIEVWTEWITKVKQVYKWP